MPAAVTIVIHTDWAMSASRIEAAQAALYTAADKAARSIAAKSAAARTAFAAARDKANEHRISICAEQDVRDVAQDTIPFR